MNRNEIDVKYTWDLSKFYSNDEEWKADYNKLKSYVNKFKKFKGKLNNKEVLKDFLVKSKECELLATRLYMYAGNNLNVQLSNQTFNEMVGQLTSLANEIEEEESFVEPELLSYDVSYLKDIISDKDFKNYKLMFKNLIKDKKHVLSEKEEKILSGVNRFAGDSSDVFNAISDVDFKFENAVDSLGEAHELTTASFSLLLKSKDQVLRESAYKNYYSKYMEFNNTIYTNYLSNLKSDYFSSSVRKYKNTLQAALDSINIPQKVYDKLKSSVRQNVVLCKEYYELRKKLLNVENLNYWDLNVSVCDDFDRKFTFEEAKEIVINALKPMGEEYISLIRRAFDERWIDVYPSKDKLSGGYETDCYGFTPIILLNFVGVINDVFTLAHELGHALHSYYSRTFQPYETSEYTLFLAEIASTFNEVLLNKYFLNNAKTNEEKLFFLDKYVQLFNGTVFRQMQYTEFEEFAHDLVENNKPVSKELLNQKYFELNAFYNPVVVNDDLKKYHWSLVPHFYRSFYCYQYVTGLISSMTLAINVLSGESEKISKYFKFLKSGGSDYSINILKRAGVDLSCDEPYTTAFKEMEWAINVIKKLI